MLLSSNLRSPTKIKVSSFEFEVPRSSRLETQNSEQENPKPETRNLCGDEREMESGLIFNQLICEFESRHPRQANVNFGLRIAESEIHQSAIPNLLLAMAEWLGT